MRKNRVPPDEFTPGARALFEQEQHDAEDNLREAEWHWAVH